MVRDRNELRWSDDPWRRVNDGMPPVAREVCLGDDVIGRVIDCCEYFPDGSVGREEYAIELLIGGRFFEFESRAVSAEAALDVLVAWLVPTEWDDRKR
jgi:hypothetical protein